MKRIYALMLALLMGLGLAGTAVAAPPGGPDEDRMMAAAPGDAAMDNARQEELRKRIETVRMWKLKDELRLDDKTSAKVSSILSGFDEKRAALRDEDRKNMQALKEALKSGKPDENQLKQIISQMEKNRENHYKLNVDETNQIKGVLTVEQQARYVLFLPKFMHEIREMMKEGRDHDGPREDRKPPREDRNW